MNLIQALCIIVIIITSAIQGVFKKAYTTRENSSSPYIFSAFTVLSAWAVFFVRALITGSLNFNIAILPYALLFASTYCIAAIFNLMAIQTGSLALSSLILSYSIIIPTLYGLIFDGDPTSVAFFIGLAFLAVSMIFINKTTSTTKIRLKWFIFVMISFFGNGVCSTTQPVQSVKFDNKYDDVFMIISLAIVFIVLFGFAIVKDRHIIKPTLKTNGHLMIACGLSNAITNLLVMVSTSININMSLLFPLLGAGGIVIAWAISVFFYKEKLAKTQHFGLVLGIVAIVFLNITPTAPAECCTCEDGNCSQAAEVCCTCEDEDNTCCCADKEEACCTCEGCEACCSCCESAVSDQSSESEAPVTE